MSSIEEITSKMRASAERDDPDGTWRFQVERELALSRQYLMARGGANQDAVLLAQVDGEEADMIKYKSGPLSNLRGRYLRMRRWISGRTEGT